MHQQVNAQKWFHLENADLEYWFTVNANWSLDDQLAAEWARRTIRWVFEQQAVTGASSKPNQSEWSHRVWMRAMYVQVKPTGFEPVSR